MNNETIKISTAIIVTILLLTLTPIQGQSFDKTNIHSCVDINTSTRIAENFLTYKEKSDFSIQSIDELYDESEGNVIGYIFHLSPKGYIIISSSQKVRPVIAYSFTSNIKNSEKINPLQQLYSKDIPIRIDFYDFQSNDIKGKITEEWNTFTRQSIQIDPLSTDFQQWPPEDTTTTEGWIETIWSQDSPYNDFCPYDKKGGGRSVAGCPSIAMAQILNYHKTTGNIQFNDSDDYYHNYVNKFYIDDDYEEYDFPSFPTLNQYLTTLQNHYETNEEITDIDVAALTFACGVAATQVYTSQGSGTFGIHQAMDAYERFNCDTAQLYYKDSSEEVFNKIKWNIKHALPVHFAVVTPAWNAGHNLIIDGYNTDDYYHLNFGWGGMYDGWYDLPDEIPYDLTVVEGVILNIYNSTDTADLVASGSIQLSDITPGSTANGSFTIENQGEADSLLSWEIQSYPDWGLWHFSQNEGTNVTPEQKEITINVNVEVPSEKTTTFTGGIKIINRNSPNDFEIIPISITTQKTKPNVFINNFLLYYLKIMSNFRFYMQSISWI